MDALISEVKLQILDVHGTLAAALPATLWPLSKRHALVTSPETIPHAPSWTLTDVTSVYSAIRLTGANATDVLQKLTTLNVNEHAMPAGSARQGRLAHVNAILLREQGSFLILNTRDLTQHMWEALAHAGARS